MFWLSLFGCAHREVGLTSLQQTNFPARQQFYLHTYGRKITYKRYELFGEEDSLPQNTINPLEIGKGNMRAPHTVLL